MDNLDPWNMLSNDFMAVDDDGDREDMPFSIPSPVQDMQVKEEPQEIDDELDGDDNENVPFHFLLGAHKNDPNNEIQIRNREDDSALFDFGLDSSNSQNHSFFNKSAGVEKDFPNLDPEDKYYNAMVKFEDAIIYICPACGREFSSQDAWKNHLNVIHFYNTRRGLNFIQIDKLYHECMECHKRIAMHSMENLLKHKFTHLPYRCSKCMVCKRQYKYRQDLMVHLRMTHRDDLIEIVKKEHKNSKENNSQMQTIRSILSKPDSNSNTPSISIGSVKENARDVFDSIEVKNEVLNEDEDDTIGEDDPPPSSKTPAVDLPVFLDDGSTNGSTNDQPIVTSHPNKATEAEEIDSSLEEYILFTCPQCGTECETQAQWRQHIEFVHEFGTRRGLNFRELFNQQAQCMSCNLVLSNRIHTLQVHKFSHLPYKEWMSCKLCFTSFNSNSIIIEHLADRHHLVSENIKPAAPVANEEDSQEGFGFDNANDALGAFVDDYDYGGGRSGYSTADKKNVQSVQDYHNVKVDIFEQHITYICPACGKEYNDKKIWRKHIVEVHKLGELENLNFENISDRQLRCRECDKIITNAYGIQNAQQHRMTHLQYKSFAKCRLCRKTYTDRKGLIKHLRNSHKVGYNFGFNAQSPSSAQYGNSASSGNSFFKPFVKKPYKIAHYPPKEIVRLSNYTYEIVHLIEDDDDDDEVTVTGTYDFAKGDFHHIYRNHHSSYGATPPKRPNTTSMEQITRHKCVDCGSIFPTPQSLQHHIQQEHEFIDYRNSPSSAVANKPVQNEEKANDVNDLLVPSRDVEAQPPPDDQPTMDCNFIYLCPQCGLEFRSQVQWRRHINMEHNFDKRESLGFRPLDKFRYQCTTCKDTVTSSKLKGLQDHKFRHCPHKLYLKCLICGQSYNHKPNMIAHLRQRHNIVEIMDGGVISTAKEPMQHRNSSHSNNKEFVDSPARPIRTTEPIHYNNTSRPPGLKTVEDVISFHNAVDHETIKYSCPSCNQHFDSHVYWRKHIVDVHNLNSREGLNFRQLDEHHYICLQCYKRVTVTHTKGAIGQLQSHKFRHLPYKSFHCTACDGEFVRKQMFFKHLDKNTNKCSGVNVNVEPNFGEGNDSSSAAAGNNDENAGTDEMHTTLLEKTGADSPSHSKFSWPTKSSLPEQPSTSASNNESISENQGCFTLNCPQCGEYFETTRAWREHINIEHNLNNRTVLNFRKINAKQHLCLECHEHVNGRKLRDLQVHKFKHLAYGAYLHCRFCSMKYFHISNMQEHLKNKHPNMVQKMKNLEEAAATAAYDEEDDANVDASNDADTTTLDDEVDERSNTDYEDIVDMDLLEAEAEIEEVDPDNVESDEQYLLG